MNRRPPIVAGLIMLIIIAVSPSLAIGAGSWDDKPSPEEALAKLKQGNERFRAGRSEHPRQDARRLAQAAREKQSDHAYATIISCSDSRVPVEMIFDAGIMDLFVVRVAGNVMKTDEAGSIEYGTAHVYTPILVVMGHTQCGAVAAVTKMVQGASMDLERNIPPLVAPIIPAVKKAMHDHPEAEGLAVVPYATEENVWMGIEALFRESPSTVKLVKQGKVKVIGAIYDLADGKVTWLPEKKVADILARVAP